IEQTTAHGIPFSWLTYYGLPTNDGVETLDLDGDGYTTLQEWLLDTNPTNAAPGLTLTMGANLTVTVQSTSPRRTYELQRTTALAPPTWQVLGQLQGTGGDLVFDVSASRSQYPKAFYRVRPKLY